MPTKLTVGAKKVIISAPATNPDATVLLGINDNIMIIVNIM
jgi:glyceraldehyde-3-phosphate dehydrogenase/erythrose-4-phosphate dehydrogenase